MKRAGELMCNVCVASAVLETTRCKDNQCPAFRSGYEIRWRSHKTPGIWVRARGKGAEFQPAEYQITTKNHKWPKHWRKTKDLAGTMGAFGFDVKWKYVPSKVKRWINGKGMLPTEKELRSR